MYAHMSPFTSARRHPGAMYRSIGVETELSSASAHHLVAMLFNGLLEAVAQARGAIQARDVAAKGQAIGRAVRIVEEGLKAGLDLQEGGRLAQDLQDLYAYMTLRLTQANLRSDPKLLDEVKALALPLQEAWQSIAPEVTRKVQA
jgi:flagellar secretion chaperone FliS